MGIAADREAGADERRIGRIASRCLCVACAFVGVAAAMSFAAGAASLEGDERARILAHGPWPPAARADPSNRVSENAAAIALGERLFHTARLSTVGGLRCASCHEPWRSFTDGRSKAIGAEAGQRNTQGLLNVGLNRWFGWDGANDTLWGQSVRPMLDPREMRASPAHVARLMRDDAELGELYRRAFDAAPSADDEAVLVAVGKALAAYQATLISPRTAFDEFRDALQRGDTQAAARYPVEARRGLQIFEGRGGCARCHTGATFSDGRFHRSLIESIRFDGERDNGRATGSAQLKQSAYRRSGRFSDAAGPGVVVPEVEPLSGAFRTPGLREVAATAPYMHDGSVDNLCEALRPHAVATGDPHVAAEPLSLAERRDLLAFLRTLSAKDPPFADEAMARCR